MAHPSGDLTVQEVVQDIGMSRKTVLKMIQRGIFPGAYRSGAKAPNSRWLVPAADVANYKNPEHAA